MSKNERKTIKVTVNLPEAMVDALKVLAYKNGVTVTEQIQRAIATENWLDEVRRVDRVMLMSKEGGGLKTLREVIFK
jgi:hypothetical protein